MSANDPHTLLAQTRAFNAELERLLGTIPAVNTVPVEQTRRARREGTGIFPPPVLLAEARTIEVDGPAGPIPLRVVAPEVEPAGAFLHIHGGGWTLGDHDGQDPLLARTARDLHGRHPGPAARRHALHGGALARGWPHDRVAGLARGSARVSVAADDRG